ncbi:MAG TPA: NUMOD1 domain-containing DNA-binding protein [Puia sp.]|nr:NUMOD1 domain-containing DNA-binding protein [Puia sp.]
MATRGERMQRAVARGRFDSSLKHMSEEARAKMLLNVARAQQKEVSQYSLSGKKIRTYESMAAASRALGLSEGVISKVAKGKLVTAGGYVWRWGKEKNIDMQHFLADRRKTIRERNGSRITQYSLTGKRIAVFATAMDAQEATGISAANCLKVANGFNKSAGGFYWKKGAGPAKIDLRKYTWGNQSGAIKRRKAVAQYDLNGKYIRTFTSVTAAAEHMGIGIIGISTACRGLQHTCKGYKWKFA